MSDIDISEAAVRAMADHFYNDTREMLLALRARVTELERSPGGARDSLEAGLCACPDPHITTCLHLSNCYEVQQIAKRAAEGRAPEPSEQHQQALDRACYVIMELMQAYERRIRSDCITQAQIDNKPWECAEYIKGERFLKAIWKDGRAQPFAALDEFLGYLRSAPEPGGDDVADKLWRMCVKDGWPWSDGSIQDKLTEIGLLYPKDMTQEDEAEQCANCEGDCRTCYRAVEHVRDAKPLPETKGEKP